MATGMKVRGTPEFRARLRAIKQTFRPIGRKWATSTARHARATAPRRTGKGAKSIRVRSASTKRATVVANYYMAILDKGSKQYTIVPKKARKLVFQAGGNTVFAKKVTKPAQRGLGYAKRAADKGMRDNPMAEELIKLWNGAA
jgi:hypothetical protein